MSKAEIEHFLSHLATMENVAAAAQNQPGRRVGWARFTIYSVGECAFGGHCSADQAFSLFALSVKDDVRGGGEKPSAIQLSVI